MNIVITGCSRGIGFNTVKALASAGNHKIIGISRTNSGLLKLQKALGKDVFYSLPFDIKDLIHDSTIFIKSVISVFDHIDVIINNAGFLIKKPFGEYSIQEIDEIFKVNLIAPSFLIQALLPYMGKLGRSHIVNIGSMAGYQGAMRFPGLSWYSSSKAALASLTENLAVELKGANISVNCLAIGAADTEMLAQAFPGYNAPVTAEEMGKFVADFALNCGYLFNGKIIPVALSNP
jgi:NAD(P)-dependent dehydrogenase (short-subunit alcohol dehydrogenase family)